MKCTETPTWTLRPFLTFFPSARYWIKRKEISRSRSWININVLIVNLKARETKNEFEASGQWDSWNFARRVLSTRIKLIYKYFHVLSSSPAVLNVAAGKAPMQISTDGAGIPQKAIDGSTSSFFSAETCSLTKSERIPWWYVNLLEPYMVQLVRLDFGKSCCGKWNRVWFYCVWLACKLFLGIKWIVLRWGPLQHAMRRRSAKQRHKKVRKTFSAQVRRGTA